MLCYSFRLILYVYGVLENDGQLIMSGSMMNNPCLGCVEINTNFILYENRNRYFTIILCYLFAGTEHYRKGYINASISNVDGTFVLDSQPEEYRLIVQHLLYRTKEIEGKGRDVGVIQLDPQDYALDEVVVKAERPFVKVEEGRLGYDLSVLAGDGVVNNAYEALTKLPGVKETKGVLTLAGTGNLTVVLNGKPTTMDAGQLETLLRNTPLDRVEKAEVMYSAPPEYHVR